MPSISDIFGSYDQAREDDEDKERQAEEWMNEYQKLAMRKRSDREETKLKELHVKLSEYRSSDPLKFDKKFQSIVSEILAQQEAKHRENPKSSAPGNKSRRVNESPKGFMEDTDGAPDEPRNEENPQENTHPIATSKPPSASLLQDEDGGVAEFYSKAGSFPGRTRIIRRYGPREAAIYEFGESRKHSQEELEGLPLISSQDKTVLDILEGGKRVYSYVNIASILYVIILRPNPERKPSQPLLTKKGKMKAPSFPDTIIEILWGGIQEQHLQSLKLKSKTSWNTRGAIMNKIKRKERAQLQRRIHAAAQKQDFDYDPHGSNDQKRLPTFWPDDVIHSGPAAASFSAHQKPEMSK